MRFDIKYNKTGLSDEVLSESLWELMREQRIKDIDEIRSGGDFITMDNGKLLGYQTFSKQIIKNGKKLSAKILYDDESDKYEARVWIDKEWDYSYTRMSTDDVDREIRNERIEGLGV